MVGFLVVILLIGVVIAIIVRQRHKERSGQKPLDDMLPTRASQLTPSPEAPSVPVEADLGSADTADAWEALRDLLSGNGGTVREKQLANNGRFHTQGGLRYTVYHDDGVCVVVCVKSVRHAMVVRTICNMTERWVAQVEEPRLEPEIPGINSAQARNTNVTGLVKMESNAIAFFTLDMKLTYPVDRI